ncbi:ATP-binding cassette domain-containing protein [Streptomyces sp. NPDC006475]|uniref:ATP-binding cassette domain-containing protein n=1 Tax=Streptomyces sp. NPDC006475 TaxID=3155719 RepID=UPI0033A574E4
MSGDEQRIGVIALAGQNGAGETPLLIMAVGLVEPTEGGVSVLKRLAGEWRWAHSSLYVSQELALYRSFTIEELLEMGVRMNRWELDRGWAHKRLEALGIPSDRRAGKPSGGQQARAPLTLTLAKHPDLLILD